MEFALRYLVANALACRRWSNVEEALTALPYLETKARAGLIEELIEEFDRACDLLPPERSAWHLVHLLRQGLRRHAQFLSRHPASVFQCLWNACWWADDLTADRRRQAPPRRRRRSMRRLLERWRGHKRRRAPEHCWMRLMCAPSTGLSDSASTICTGHVGTVRELRFSGDGLTLLSVSSDGSARVWRTSSGTQRHEARGTTEPVVAVSYLEGAEPVLLALAGGMQIRIVAIRNLAEIGTIQLSGAPGSVASSPDGRLALVAYGDRKAELWNLPDRRRVRRCTLRRSDYRELRVSDRGDIAGLSDDGDVDLWHAEGRKRNHLPSCYAAAIGMAAEGSAIAYGGMSSVNVYWVDEQRPVICETDAPSPITCVAVSPDGARIAGGTATGVLRLWDGRTGRLLAQWSGAEGPISCVALGGNQLLACGLADGTIIVLRTAKLPGASRAGGQVGQVWATAVHPKKALAAAAGTDAVGVWDAKSGKSMVRFETGIGPEGGLAFLSNGNDLIVWDGGPIVRVLEVGSWRERCRHDSHGAPVKAVTITDDDKWAVSAATNGEIHAWSVLNGSPVTHIRDVGASIESLDCSRNKRWIAAGLLDGSVRVWDARNGDLAMEGKPEGGGFGPARVRFTGNDDHLVVVDADDVVRLFDLLSGELLAEREFTSSIVAFGVADDRGRIVLQAEDFTASVLSADDLAVATRSIGTIMTQADIRSLMSPKPPHDCCTFPVRPDVAVLRRDSGIPVAWCPDAALTQVRPRTWFGYAGTRVVLYKLEGHPEMKTETRNVADSDALGGQTSSYGEDWRMVSDELGGIRIALRGLADIRRNRAGMRRHGPGCDRVDAVDHRAKALMRSLSTSVAAAKWLSSRQ